MADWHKFTGCVHEINGKINFIDPNDLFLSNGYIKSDTDRSVAYEVNNDIKGFGDVIRHEWLPEDYCIDVDICMEVPSRNDYATSVNNIYLLNWNASEDRLSMMSGQRFYYGENSARDNAQRQKESAGGEPILEHKNSVNYLSTRDYESNFQDVLGDNISTEMLGIKSIKIEYSSAFVPLVTIDMCDVRGVAVFSPLEHSHNKIVNNVSGYDNSNIAGSFYRALFNLPYPKVTMKVKGLYGAPTTYDLTFKNISQSFNSENGSFDVKLELIGYYYSFLTEVPVLHAMLSPYFELYGKDYWDNYVCTDESHKLDGDTPISWIELVKRVTDAQIRVAKDVKEGNGEVGKITKNEDIQTKTNQLLELIRLMGANFLVGCLKTNDKAVAVVSNDQGASGASFSMIGYAGEQNDSFSVRNLKLIEEFKNVYEPTLEKIKSLNEELKGLINDFGGYGDINLNLEVVEADKLISNINWDNGVTFADVYNNKGLNVLEDSRKSEDSSLINVADGLAKCDCVHLFSIAVKKTDGKYYPIFDEYNKIYSHAEGLKQELAEQTKQETIKIVNDSIGFNPTLRNVMKLLISHCETYFHTLYHLTAEIGKQKDNGDRQASVLGLVKDESDFRSDDVPPFPQVTSIQKDRRVQDWTGSLPSGNQFLETDYVNSVMNACENGITEINAVKTEMDSSVQQQNQTGGDGTSSAETQENQIAPVRPYRLPAMPAPVTLADIMVGGWAFQSLSEADFDSMLNDGNLSSLVTVLYLRFLQYYGFSKVEYINNPSSEFRKMTFFGDRSANSVQTFGKLDAVNFFYQFVNLHKFNENMAVKLESVLNSDSFDYELNGTLIGNAHKDFNPNDEKLSTYYQAENGFEGDKLTSSSTLIIPSNNQDGGTNVVAYSSAVGGRKSEDQIIADDSVIYKKSNSNVCKPSTLAELKALKYNFKNYAVIYDNIDNNLNIPQLKEYNGGNLSKYIKEGDIQKLPIYGFVPFDGPTDDYKGSFEYSAGTTYDCALFNYKTDSFYENEVQTVAGGFDVNSASGSSSKNRKRKNPPIIATTNVFTSVWYYGISDSNSKCNQGTTQAMRASYVLLGADGLDWDEDGYAGRYYKPNLTSGKMSNLQLLQNCAICFAHYFNNDVIYSVDFDYYEKYVEAVNKWDMRDPIRCTSRKNYTAMADWNGLENTPLSYVMALHFIEWVASSYNKFASLVQIPIAEDATQYGELVKQVDKIWYGTHESSNAVDAFGRLLDINKSIKQWRAQLPAGYEKGDGVEVLWWDLYESNPACARGLDIKLTEETAKVLTAELTKTVFVGNNNIEPSDGLNYDLNKSTSFSSYTKEFLKQLSKMARDNQDNEREQERQREQYGDGNNKVSQVDESKMPIDPKISVYQATKRLWDKWLCGCRQRESGSFVVKNWLDMNFFNERFHFIDSFYNDIGDDLIIDVNILVNTFIEAVGQQQDWNLLSYINYVLGQSQIQFHNIQNWADLGNSETMAKAFVPMSWVEANGLDDPNSHLNNTATNSDFVCIYSYEPSHLLGDRSTADPNNDFVGDGFTITATTTATTADNLDLPPEVGYNLSGQWKIPAFAVTYGKQYQSYFQNINVQTDKGMQTEWALMATMQIAKMGSDKVGENTQYIGQDLYTVKSNQSFTVDVDMLGCAWVQPLMYFVLTNVPMYRGTYMIYKVEHNITAGSMKTHFSGVKMSRIANRIVQSGMFNSFGTSNSSNGVSVENKIASLSNDCGYKFFSPVDTSNFDSNYENTTNIEALKSYCPPYIVPMGYSNMWEAICGTVERECGSMSQDALEQKLVALTIFNNHALFAGHKRGYQKLYKARINNNSKGIKGAWQQVLCQAYRCDVHKKASAKIVKLCESIFNDPINAILGGKQYIDIACPDFQPSYHEWYTKPDGSKGIKAISGKTYRLRDLPAHYHQGTKGTRISGTLGTKQKRIDRTTLRTIAQYSTGYEYADGKEFERGCHYQFDFQFCLAEAPSRIYIFEDSDCHGEIWDDNQFSSMAKNPNSQASATSDDTLVDGYVKALQQSMSETEAFAGDSLKTLATYQNYILLSCGKQEHNALLFDMIVRKPDNGVSEGYYGWNEYVVWVTDSKSSDNPTSILVNVVKATESVRPKFYFHITSDNITTLNGDIVSNLCSSNLVSIEQKGKDLKDVPNNFWKVMAKNVSLNSQVNSDQYLMSFAYAFGGSEYLMANNWGNAQGEDPEQMTYYLKSNNAESCAKAISESEYATGPNPVEFSDVNATYQDLFKDFDDYQNRTLRCSKGSKLSNDVFKGPVEGNQRLTSHYSASRTVKGVTRPHRGTDFAGSVAGAGYAIAGYDGIVTNVFKGDGYGWVVTVVYNIQNEKGELMCCGYPHIDSCDSSHIFVTKGQKVMAGDKLAKLGSLGAPNCTGVHSHFFMAFAPKTQKFTWGVKYGGTNGKLLLGTNCVNPEDYIDFKYKNKK